MATASRTKNRRVIFNESLSNFYTLYLPQISIRYFPLDITRFLVWKDRKGKTKKIHVPACSLFGTKQASLCACPTNLAAGKVDNLIGKLRSLFIDLDRGRKVTEVLDASNPASHASIRQYLVSIREEQAQARVTPRQVTPLVHEKKR